MSSPFPLLAVWHTSHPILAGIGVGLAGLILTAVGSGVAIGAGFEDPAATWVITAFVTLSALLGLLWMWRTRPTLAEYGFRAPQNLRSAAWGLPLLLLPLAVLVTGRPALSGGVIAAYLVFTVAVGFNEEIWYRGLLLAALRRLGERRAVIAGAVLFGVLHLANVAQGQSALQTALQLGFALLVGWVLGELVTVTRSLWIGIAWHMVYDFVAFAFTDPANPATEILAVGLCDLVLLAYGWWLWQKMPTRPAPVAPDAPVTSA